MHLLLGAEHINVVNLRKTHPMTLKNKDTLLSYDFTADVLRLKEAI